jgi:hypothetical protein
LDEGTVRDEMVLSVIAAGTITLRIPPDGQKHSQKARPMLLHFLMLALELRAINLHSPVDR